MRFTQSECHHTMNTIMPMMQAYVNKFTAMTTEEKAQRLGLVMPSSQQGRKLKWGVPEDTSMQSNDRFLNAIVSIPDWSTGAFPSAVLDHAHAHLHNLASEESLAC